jgi:Na+/proline symporter
MNTDNSNLKCHYHPERAAVGTCANCGKTVCPECKVVLSQKCYCNPCAEEAYTSAASVVQSKSDGWFARHLNWTTVLTWVGAAAVSFVAGFVVGVVMYGADITRTETVAAFAGYIAALAWLLVTNGWVLRRKGQSEWHLLLLLVPFGFLFILALQNKTAAANEAKPPAI